MLRIGKEINIVSYGGGVNSTALIIFMHNNKIKIDEVLFADVGSEMPETYKFLPIFKKWCRERNIKFTTVKSHLGNLRETYYEKKIIPYRMYRSCTDKFKIRPIHKYIKEKYGRKEDIIINLGIDADEKKRARIKEVNNTKTRYLLVENDIGRDECKNIIKNEGLPIPVKSGCYFCPFQNKNAWIKLYKDHPKLFQDSIIFEENCKAFPEFHLGQIPLRKLKKAIDEQRTLFKNDNKKIMKCMYCHT